MKLDTNTLTNVITHCFDYSMDGRFSPAQRSAFLARGKRLRGSLLNLLSARFKEGDQHVRDANEGIAAVNATLAQQANVLEKTAATLESLAKLVGVVDGLVEIAVAFV